MKKIISLALAVSILSIDVLAQKDLSMQDAVLGLGTNLRIEDIPQLGFRPGTQQITRVVGTGTSQAYVAYRIGEQVDTLLRLQELKIITNEDARSIPSIQWINEHEFWFQYSNKIYRGYTNNGKTIANLWTELPDEAEELTVSKNGQILSYVRQNNLFYVDKNGRTQAITHITKPHIIAGKSVHRNEFGISTGTFIAPKGNAIAFYEMDESMVADYPIIDWQSVPAENKNIKYPMAGGLNHEVRVGVYHIASGKALYLATPQPLKDYYLTCVTWSPDEKYIYIAVLNRDQRHMQMLRYDAHTGAPAGSIFTETHPKYVEPQHSLFFLAGGKEFVWHSQRDGFMHLYRYTADGRLLNPITYGDWQVKEILGINEAEKKLILLTTKGDPRETSIYSVHYETGKMQKLSQEDGVHFGTVSDDGRFLIDHYRNSNTPRNIELLDLKNREITNLLKASNPLQSYNLAEVQDVRLQAADGSDLYGKLMLPKDFDPSKKYPVIYYLYNGPHVQLITNSFPASGNLWYDYMTQKGFIVFSMDGRGSANRGLDFEQAIHNQLGTIEMQDHMLGVDYLRGLPFVDAARMGIYGWSYGGFMTTSFMTRYPDVFAAGVAGGPVIDWKMYEIMYTERYMSHPSENVQGYRDNNLSLHADKLKSKLLLIHGTDDDVVVWQHSLKFIQSCVEKGIPVDYFAYPGHQHNVRGRDRVHLMQKISDYFILHLKP